MQTAKGVAVKLFSGTGISQYYFVPLLPFFFAAISGYACACTYVQTMRHLIHAIKIVATLFMIMADTCLARKNLPGFGFFESETTPKYYRIIM